ncbi:MAG: glycoside hydrolase family 97 protein [Bacteroides sp.]|nr:glycoside hydrolase family 97 protein [Bacteroides sp.]
MKHFFLLLFLLLSMGISAQQLQITSPDGNIQMQVMNADRLSYSISYNGKTLVYDSPLGFELKGEKPMLGGFVLLGTPQSTPKTESWTPVVKNKHAQVSLAWSEMTLNLKEKSGDCRRMDLIVRVYDNGVAFRYQLYGARKPGDRQITRELTGFTLPKSATVWAAKYNRNYTSSQESEFEKIQLTSLPTDTVAGLPFLIEVDKQNYLAITEAYINDYPGFYIGKTGVETDELMTLTTKLSPLPGEAEDGVKARFAEQMSTPWRVIMVGSHPGRFIESEIIAGLNPPCAIEDPSWIKPGLSAWDHWWSGEVKMETDVIKEYIDLAAAQGWPYMLIDWQWYGPYNKAIADITKPAPQLDMPGILAYARSKNVRCWLWLYCTDVNKDDSYKEAFALYEKWGIAGVKIDFMDRDDQQMVNWYRRIVKTAAEHHLMVDFHGAYKPDGIDRTYPNLLTREGVLGEEYSKFSNRIIPEHNITLAFTRMLAGPMDYTPGGFLNVTRADFKQQSPTLVANTRCAELSKFVIYESPLTVVSDHPKHILGQPGADFLKVVPTEWDDTRFLDGYPGEYILMAKRKGNDWFIGAMNNSVRRTLTVDTSFLPTGTYELEYWADGPHADKKPTEVTRKTVKLTAGKPLKLKLAVGGGYVGIVRPVE